MHRDERIQGIRYATLHDRAAEQRAVAAGEPPARVPLPLGKRREERRGVQVVQRQDREAPTAVEANGDTRRPAAEASACVVEQDRPLQAHRALSNPSSVARTSGPIVSRT